ncbi:hypothetical protein SVAN01_11084 [Stagonosporopsis vannaccii]|nr:hypothetical protein SVAN01_11084 [Stagonosporopsis vannaccii]
MSTNTASPKGKILVVGVRLNIEVADESHRNQFGTPEKMKADMDEDKKRVREMGYEIDIHLLDDRDPEPGFVALEEKLKAEGVEVYVVGAGLRLIPQNLPLFERAVHLYRHFSPRSVLLFNDGPGGNSAALLRNKKYLN